MTFCHVPRRLTFCHAVFPEQILCQNYFFFGTENAKANAMPKFIFFGMENAGKLYCRFCCTTIAAHRNAANLLNFLSPAVFAL